MLYIPQWEDAPMIYQTVLFSSTSHYNLLQPCYKNCTKHSHTSVQLVLVAVVSSFTIWMVGGFESAYICTRSWCTHSHTAVQLVLVDAVSSFTIWMVGGLESAYTWTRSSSVTTSYAAAQLALVVVSYYLVGRRVIESACMHPPEDDAPGIYQAVAQKIFILQKRS
jgi:hypothetical protein